jgi:tetratricopeptide (TPR) repeat protein
MPSPRGHDLLARAAFTVGLAAFGASIVVGLVGHFSREGRLPGLSLDPSPAGRAALARGDRERALREFRAGAAINPGFDSLVRASEALAVAGDVPGAWALVEKARQLGPGRPELATAKGRILFFTGRRDEAAAAFRQAIAQNPTDSRALAGLGEILLDRDDLAGAITVLSQAVVLDPDATAARNSLGIAYALGGDSPTADFVANLARARAALAASQK